MKNKIFLFSYNLIMKIKICLLLIIFTSFVFIISYKESKTTFTSAQTGVIFTFDDGPNNDNTLHILNVLEKYNMSATFFVVGNKINSQKDVIKKIYKSHSEIGYHSYDHKLLTTKKGKQIKNDFDKTEKIYYEITKDYLPYVRPPYGSINKKVIKNINIPFILWNKDTNDWKYKDSAYIEKYVKENINEGDIFLFHDSYKTTLDAIENLIPCLYENNIKVYSVSNYIKEKNIKLFPGQKYYFFK